MNKQRILARRSVRASAPCCLPAREPTRAFARPNEEASLTIPIDSIDPNPLQPRRMFQSERLSELAQSIRANASFSLW